MGRSTAKLEPFTFTFERDTYRIEQTYNGQPTRIYLEDGRVLVVTRWEIASPMRAIPESIEQYDPTREQVEDLAASNHGFVARREEPPESQVGPATAGSVPPAFLLVDLSDLPCPRCPEVYDAYAMRHEGLLTREERRHLLQGDGCPACAFGTKTEVLLSKAEHEHRYELLLEHWYTASQ